MKVWFFPALTVRFRRSTSYREFARLFQAAAGEVSSSLVRCMVVYNISMGRLYCIVLYLSPDLWVEAVETITTHILEYIV